jgi:CTP synthase (UTP-ammonia lyase)
MRKRIALLGEYTPTFEPHRATLAAVQHSCAALSLDLDAEWVSTEDIDTNLFRRFHGMWIAPGSPYKNMGKTIWAIQQARESAIPCLGTCGGFQHIVIEYARHVLGFRDAQHAEYDPYASDLFISALACSLSGREMTLRFVSGSRVATMYGQLTAREAYYCNFGVHPDRVSLLRRGPLQVTGSDEEGEVRVVELPDHPFFVGTLFVPQTRSQPGLPHPLISAFVKSVSDIDSESAIKPNPAVRG